MTPRFDQRSLHKFERRTDEIRDLHAARIGKPSTLRAYSRPILPGIRAIAGARSLSATRIYTSTDAIQAASDMGSTMPVVPKIERPPTTPKRGLKVLRAIVSPPIQPMN